MHYSTITAKGQITIPAIVRDRLQLKAGSQLRFIVHGNSLFAIPFMFYIIQIIELKYVSPK